MSSNTMHRLACFMLLLIFAAPPGAVSAYDAEYPQPTSREKLASIAHHVLNRGNEEQRDFVLLAIDAMINAYSQVLHHATENMSEKPELRRKQTTWNWATSKTIASLVHDERDIEAGMPFELYVDNMQQIMVLTKGKVIVVSGPHTASQSTFEQQVVDFYCLTRECGWLTPKPKKPSKKEKTVKRRLAKGSWYFQQQAGPVFVIGGLIHFQFTDFSNNENKARLSQEISAEVEQLVLAVDKLNKANNQIDW